MSWSQVRPSGLSLQERSRTRCQRGVSMLDGVRRGTGSLLPGPAALCGGPSFSRYSSGHVGFPHVLFQCRKPPGLSQWDTQDKRELASASSRSACGGLPVGAATCCFPRASGPECWETAAALMGKRGSAQGPLDRHPEAPGVALNQATVRDLSPNVRTCRVCVGWQKERLQGSPRVP